jgi:uncharacterized protein (TIGR02594 family)
MKITAYQLAQRFVGTTEVSGRMANPLVMAMLNLDASWPEDDEVPWCSGFVNFVCWLLRLPRSKSLRARSWLNVGIPIPLSQARVGWDVVIINRGGPHDPNIIDAPGHVTWYGGMLDLDWFYGLGGNQSDTVKLSRYAVSDILGVRRLYEEAT